MNWIHSFQLEDFLKLMIAAVFGIIIGFEREIKNKPVGIRTSLVITLISCLLTIVSIKSVVLYSTIAPNVQMDPMRLVAQVVAGIGFIGAGVILRRPHDIVSGSDYSGHHLGFKRNRNCCRRRIHLRSNILSPISIFFFRRHHVDHETFQ